MLMQLLTDRPAHRLAPLRDYVMHTEYHLTIKVAAVQAASFCRPALQQDAVCC